MLLDFNDSAAPLTAMKLHESGEVDVSTDRLSDIADDARAATDALETDEMRRTTNERY